MQLLEVSGAVRPIYGSLGVKPVNERDKFMKNVSCFKKKKKLFLEDKLYYLI
jgi:hypothetical protein